LGDDDPNAKRLTLNDTPVANYSLNVANHTVTVNGSGIANAASRICCLVFAFMPS
jgi:hypothetical protein